MHSRALGEVGKGGGVLNSVGPLGRCTGRCRSVVVTLSLYSGSSDYCRGRRCYARATVLRRRGATPRNFSGFSLRESSPRLLLVGVSTWSVSFVGKLTLCVIGKLRNWFVERILSILKLNLKTAQWLYKAIKLIVLKLLTLFLRLYLRT